MSINIGDNNKIKNSHIGDKNGKENEKNSFAFKHPILTSVITSLIVGIVLLFSFWDKVINMIEEMF